jgi:hypothetical protein
MPGMPPALSFAVVVAGRAAFGTGKGDGAGRRPLVKYKQPLARGNEESAPRQLFKEISVFCKTEM